MYGSPVGTLNITGSGYLITHVNSTTSMTTNLSTRVFLVHLISGGSPSVLTISNGQTGSVLLKMTGTANTGVNFDFGINGILFPQSAYATVDGNIVSATIILRGDRS